MSNKKNEKAPEMKPQQETAAPEAKAEPAAQKAETKKSDSVTVTREEMEKMEGLAGKLAGEKEKYLRLAAEYDNYRKRTAREKENIYADARIETIKKFLAVYDNLERGLAQCGEDDPHRQGMEMIVKQFLEILRDMDVTEMDDVGKPFDPNRHNAVMHVDDENLGENVVADVFQKGFMMGDRVLRFAVVKAAN